MGGSKTEGGTSSTTPVIANRRDPYEVLSVSRDASEQKIKAAHKKLALKKQAKKKESTWRIFSLKELHSATNNFNYDNKLGEGGFGSVYWGQLWDGSQIAVKRLKVYSNKAEMEFAVEVEILARVMDIVQKVKNV